MVEGARLESVYTGNRIAGSNPALSAIISLTSVRFAQRLHGGGLSAAYRLLPRPQLTTEAVVRPVKRVTSAIAMAVSRTAASASDVGRWCRSARGSKRSR